jgi:acetyl-CoA acetyltransferase family protein
MPNRVAIVAGRRTAIGKANRAYSNVHPVDLLGAVLADLMSATGVDPSAVGEVIAGCTHQGRSQAVNIARNAWLSVGLPVSVAATTIDTQCGSSQEAASLAAALVGSGRHDLVVAGGVDAQSAVPMFSTWQDQSPYSPAQLKRYDMPKQGDAAELLAEKYGVTRELADAWGYESHIRTDRAWTAGAFDREITLIRDAQGKAILERDEGTRGDTTLEKLATLAPAFKKDGVITAGNASQLSDGASAVLLASEAALQRYGLQPLAWIVDSDIVGVDPILMMEGPIEVTRRLFARNGLDIGDIDLIELHEAFAVPVCAWQSVFHADPERVNLHGGGIGMGHPFGASGTRQLAHLAYALSDRPGAWGLQAMCAGGGIGTGTLLRSAA